VTRRVRQSLALGIALSMLALVHASEPAKTVVRVTAVVTNSRGEPVAGLRPKDFQITVDGMASAVDAIEFRTDKPKPRAFGLLLDEFHVDAASTDAVKAILTHFVESSVGPGDVVLVFKPLDSLMSLRPTSDLQAVLQTIATFSGRKGDYTARTTFEQRYMAQAPAAVAAARAQIVSSGLREVASRLGQLTDVRPAVVLVSDGFARQRVDRNVPANLLSAVRVANRGDVPVYVFAPTAALPPAADRSTEEDPAQVALETVASQTGGEFSGGLTNFAAGLTRMVRELDTHYILTYQAPHGEDGRFHSLQITLNRPDARVRARAGYVAPLAANLRAALSPPPTPTRVLKRSGLIQSWSGVTKGSDGKARVIFTWQSAVSRADPDHPAPTLLVVTASTPDGTVLFDGSVAAAGVAPAATGANRAEFEAPPGRVLIDVKVLDAKGVVMDADARDLEVPVIGKSKPTILAPAVLRAGSAREFRTVSEDPDAAPVPSRDFRRTDRLLLRVPAYDAGGAPARVTATLLNRWRQPMRAVPAMPESLREGITQFDISLAPLAPGEYTIRLSADGVTEHVTFRVRS
jgi:VWFA-related protein